MQNPSREAPEFILFTGSMYSGKTSRAILEVQNHLYRSRRVLAYKPKLDDRYSKRMITTHNGMAGIDAVPVETGKDLIEHLVGLEGLEAKSTTVFVDEVFMIVGVAEELVWLYRNGFSIIASSLDMSCFVQPFEEVEKIMPWTTRIEKCTAICSVCRSPAPYTWRKPDAGLDEILVGGVETYEARCANCHPMFKVTK